MRWLLMIGVVANAVVVALAFFRNEYSTAIQSAIALMLCGLLLRREDAR